MKAFFLLIPLASLSLVLAGCESDLPPDPEAQNKIERGLSGRGALTIPNKTDEPFSPENTNGGN